MDEERVTERRSIKRVSSRGGGISRTAIITIIIVVIVVAGVGAAIAYFVAFPPQRVEIVIDGSSTVFPVVAAWAEELNRRDPNTQYLVSFSGTGAGFEKFCDGRTHLSDASRPIKDSEFEKCRDAGIEPIQFQVGYDGISVVVHKTNTFAQSLTTEQLCRIWTSNTSAGACGGEGPRADKWNDINATWPDATINLWGPGTDSGTFDYFREEILEAFGDDIRGEAEWNPSEDDNVLVVGVAADPNALGYFGYAYYQENTEMLNVIAIDNGEGPVTPSPQTIENGDYAPLSRPILVYADEKGSLNMEAVKDFFRFGFSTDGQDMVTQVGYVKLSESLRQEQIAKIPV